MRLLPFFIVTVCLLTFTITHAQRVRRSFVDSNFQPTSTSKAVYVGFTEKQSDTCWQTSYYWPQGPIVRLESFADADRTLRHGRFAWYDTSGLADSAGYILNGLREGPWYVYDNDGRTSQKKVFQKGKVVEATDYTQDAGKPKKMKDSGYVNASFEGGVRGWQRYLVQNLRYPLTAIKAGYQGATRVAFVVSSKGAVEDPWMFKSVERTIDQEALRLIIDSPHWIPATKNDSRVSSALIQPIVFRIR